MKNEYKGRTTKTIVSKRTKLKSSIVFILAFTLILLPNLIAFAENEPGVQGTPTPTVSEQTETTPSNTVSDGPDTIPGDTASEKPSNSTTPYPSEDESNTPSDSPTNGTSTEPSGEVTPGPSEPPPEEPVDSTTPDPSEKESSEPSADVSESASIDPSESPSEEPDLKPAAAPLAQTTLNSVSLASGNGIVPVEHAGNDSSANAPSGYTWISIGASTITKYFDINGNPAASGPYFFTMNVGTLNGKKAVASWSSNMIIYSVIVKGGPKYNEYVYNGGHSSDTGLFAPINASNGKPYDLSHASFIYKVPPPPQPGSLKLIKKDDLGNLLANVEFRLTDNGSFNDTKTTNASGEIFWDNLDPGTYYLHETVPAGYLPPGVNPLTVKVGDSQNVVLTIVNIKARRGDFTVYKVDDNKNPLAGAIFTLTPVGGGAAIKGSESPDGTHSWTGLPLGSYTLKETTVPKGYLGDTNLPKTVIIYEGSDARNVFTAVNNPDIGDFTVYKKDDKGAALAGAVFTLTPVSGSTPITGVESPAGTHTWTDLPTGNYTLTETTLPSGYTGDPTLPTTVTVYLGADARNVYTAINTRKLGDFEVKKTDGDDQALAGAVFTLNPVGGGTAITGVESPDGTHSWTGLPTGDYTLDETTVPTDYNKGENLPRTVTVSQGTNDTVTIVNKRKVGDFVVYKVDGDKSPLAGAVFYLTPDGGTTKYYGVESPDGTHSWTDLPTGQYMLYESTVPTGYTPDPLLPKAVTVYEGSDEKNEFTAVNDPEHCSILIYKKDTSGELIVGLSITFKLERVNGDGTFTLISEKSSTTGKIFWDDLEPGDYRLTEVSAPDGYFFDTVTHNVTLTNGEDKEKDITNEEYVTIQVIKRDKLTGQVLAGAVFEISESTPPLRDISLNAIVILGRATTNAQGIATFAYPEFKLKAGVTYTVTEVIPPPGYQNDSTPNTITVNTPGGINPLEVGLFENTPILQKITVVKYLDEVMTSTIGDGTLFDGTEFQLWQGTTYLESKYLSGGKLEFTDLPPGDYIIKEIVGLTTTSFNVDTDKNVTLVLKTQENIDAGLTDPIVNFYNTYDNGDFAIIKHDADDFEIILQGAVYHLTGMHWTGTEYIETTYFLTTDINGYAEVKDLTPGNYTLKEITPPDGYKIDETTYIVVIYTDRTTEGEDIYHVSDEKFEPGSIVIAKFEEGNTTVRLAGVRFSLYKDSVSTANLIGTALTDVNGNIVWNNLEPGDYIVVEDATLAGYTIIDATKNITLPSAGYEIVIFYNRPTTTPTPTPTTPTFPPESTPTPSPSPSPTPSPTPTPIETDVLIIEDVDPAFGPETGEGDALFIAVGILLLIGGALFMLRKRFITSQ